MTDPEIRAASARFLSALQGVPNVSESQYWHAFCKPHGMNTFCRIMLNQAADIVAPVGATGWLWTFRDGSTLLVSDVVRVG